MEGDDDGSSLGGLMLLLCRILWGRRRRRNSSSSRSGRTVWESLLLMRDKWDVAVLSCYAGSTVVEVV